MAFKLALVYESGKRYIIPFEIATKTLKLSDEDIENLQKAVLKEIQKQ